MGNVAHSKTSTIGAEMSKDQKERKQRARNVKRSIDWTEFIKAWQSSSSCSEVVKKLGRPDTQSERTYVSVKAGYARKRGVALKKFVRTVRANDWSNLAKLADELGSG
jgi:hypothetical protein|tara:strand:+ start:250 stop:573 length:324 start_codon:yes stop_codon:yes gene_type:complete